jgi:glycyl-tRNA synthetase beta chain
VSDAAARAAPCTRSRPTRDSELATGFARASRILNQGSPAAEISEDVLKEPIELALYEAWRQVRATVYEAADARRYADALRVLAQLADPIDAFFEQVLVMAPDAAVRANRLALLQYPHTFLKVANGL